MSDPRLQYTVIGRWPFPLDMLRRDLAEPATAADKALIERYSTESPSMAEMDARVEVNLTMPMAHRWTQPNEKRWESFGWRVKGAQQPAPPAPTPAGIEGAQVWVYRDGFHYAKIGGPRPGRTRYIRADLVEKALQMAAAGADKDAIRAAGVPL